MRVHASDSESKLAILKVPQIVCQLGNVKSIRNPGAVILCDRLFLVFRCISGQFTTVDGQNPAPLGNHGNALSIDIYRGFIIAGFLRWCEMDVFHQ